MPTPPRTITFDGLTLTLGEWADRTGIPAETIRSRLDKQRMPTAKALTAPVAKKYDPRKAVPVNVPRPCPPMKRHPCGQAYCRWSAAGKNHWRYFGPYGSDRAAAAYRRFQLEWATGDGAGPVGGAVSIAELAVRYLKFVDNYYVKDGKRTSEVHGQRAAMRVLTDLYPELPADEFRPAHLRACVQAMVEKGWARVTVNRNTWRITKFFSWAVGQDLVPPVVWQKLEHVEYLQAGRSAAHDRDPVTAVPWEVVEKTLPHLHADEGRRALLEAMVRVAYHTGMRPGELCAMAGVDVDRSGKTWCYLVGLHKNIHRQARRKPKRVWLGPLARAVLAPFLEAAGGGPVWVFPPGRPLGRRTRVHRNRFSALIKAACEAAGVDPWHPHQLRHTRATEVERKYEDDAAAGAAIGDTPKVAGEVYVDPTDAVARRIAEATG
jgi:integrase